MQIKEEILEKIEREEEFCDHVRCVDDGLKIPTWHRHGRDGAAYLIYIMQMNMIIGHNKTILHWVESAKNRSTYH